jgi:tRNA (cmo5U34)-methyltransferase
LLETVLSKDDYFIGIDNSAAMLSVAKRQARDAIAHEFILDDIVSAEIPTWDVCFLTYTLSFIRAEERISLLSRIKSASASKSLFFFADKVKYEYPSIMNTIRARHLLFKYSQGIKAVDAETKTRSLRSVMAPWAFQEYIDAIESAGWKDPQIIQADTAFFGIVVFVN